MISLTRTAKGRRLRLLCPLVSIALLAAACGSDSESATDAVSEVSTSSSSGSSDSPMDDSGDTSSHEESASGEEALSEDALSEEASETRVVQTSIGEVEIPSKPERILALDEYAAMNLLAIGITPMEVTASYSSFVSQEILEDAGALIVEQAAFSINIEAIAAAAPDVIVVTAESAFLAEFEPLNEIAPTIVLPYTEPWRDVVASTGEIFERSDEAAHITEVLEAKIAEVSGVVAANPFTLSILGDTYGILFAVSQKSILSDIVAEVGIERPAAEIDGEPMAGYESVISISTEVLAEHEADLMAVMSGAYYAESTILDAPTFQELASVKAGGAIVVDGDMWFGTHPFAIFWILDDLAGLASGEGADAIGAVGDTSERWAAYQDLVG